MLGVPDNRRASARPAAAAVSAAAGPLSTPLDPLEAEGRKHLEAKRFRKARDTFKQLCKRDRTRYLPLLVEANVGLTREMLSKGQVSEAEQVMTYLKTIAAPSVLAQLEAEIAVRQGNWTAAGQAALARLTDDETASPAEDALRWADHAVLAFGEATPAKGVNDRRQSELDGVLRGLAALSEGRFEAALEAVAGISRQSPFAHWRWFLKGQVAFYRGDRPLAVRAFSAIPAASAPGRAAAAYQWLCGSGAAKPEDAPEAAMISRACAIMGEALPGEVLLTAEAQWRRQRLGEVYETLRNRMPGFPSESTVLMGALSHFCLNAIFGAPSDQSFHYGGYLAGIADKCRFKSPAEEMLVLRVLCLHADGSVGDELMGSGWMKVLRRMAELHGPSPRRDSIGYAWLGEHLAQEEHSPFFFFRSCKPQLRDASGAMFAYEQSLRLDPQNYEAHLALCGLYERLNRISDRNRLLDRMARQFPDRKEVLLRTGRGCLERRAFRKGLDYLTRAHELDRLDPAIPEALVEGYCELAAEQAKAGKSEMAQTAWASALALAVDQPTDLARARWTIVARQALAERAYGDPAAGERLVEQVRLMGVPGPALEVYLRLAEVGRSRGLLGAPLPAFRSAGTALSMATATLLVSVLHHWQRKGRVQETSPVMLAISNYLEAAVEQAFDCGKARALAEAIGQDERFSGELELLVDQVLGEDPADPYFRLLRVADQVQDGYPSQRGLCLRGEIESIVREALARGDDRTAHLARAMAGRIEPEGGPDDSSKGEEDPTGAGLFDETPSSLPAPKGARSSTAPLDPEDPETTLDALRGFFETMAELSEDELEELERSRPPEVPPGFIETMAEAAREPSPRRLPQRSRATPGQQQTELPF